jgi:N-acetyl-gamma-glutamyl-phosphate reductase
MSIKAGILGATGYTGVELVRLLSGHPGVDLQWLTSEKFAGKRIDEVFPHLRGFSDLECRSVSGLKDLAGVDVAFSCLPHGSSMHFAARLLDAGVRVIDFSADFRFRNAALYERLFDTAHKYKTKPFTVFPKSSGMKFEDRGSWRTRDASRPGSSWDCTRSCPRGSLMETP